MLYLQLLCVESSCTQCMVVYTGVVFQFYVVIVCVVSHIYRGLLGVFVMYIVISIF